MGRKIPLGEVHHLNHHPLLYISLLVASIAATIALVSSLCGILMRTRTLFSSNNEAKENVANIDSSSPSQTKDSPNVDTNEDSTNKSNLQCDDNTLLQPLPPPPAMRAASYQLRTNSMAPLRHSRSNSNSNSLQGKLSSSMSMKVFKSGLALRQASKRGEDPSDKKRDNKKLKHEDSIWKKQIILGEKCKVPDEDEEDTVLYDKKGNKISSYHPKPPNAMTMSRQSSDIDADAIPK